MAIKNTLKSLWQAAASLTGSNQSPPPERPLTYAEVMAFFDEQASRTDLAFGALHEGCFARTQLMYEAARQAGYTPKKAWIIDDVHNKSVRKFLVFTTPLGEDVDFKRHVLLVFPVITPAGEKLDLFIDPTFFDGPVTIEQVAAHMSVPKFSIEVLPFGKGPRNYTKWDYDTGLKTSFVMSRPDIPAYPANTLKELAEDEILPRIVTPSAYCRSHIFPALGNWPERRGTNWISYDYKPQPGEEHTDAPAATAAQTPQSGAEQKKPTSDNKLISLKTFYTQNGQNRYNRSIPTILTGKKMLGQNRKITDMPVRDFVIESINEVNGETYFSVVGRDSIYRAATPDVQQTIRSAKLLKDHVKVRTDRTAVWTAEISPQSPSMLSKMIGAAGAFLRTLPPPREMKPARVPVQQQNTPR